MKPNNLLLPALLTCACTTNPAPSDGSGSSTSPGSSDSTDGPGASDSTVTPPGMTSDGTAADDTTDGTETSAIDECDFPQPGAIECQPPGTTQLEFTVLIDGIEPSPNRVDPLDPLAESCTVSAVADDGTLTTVQLACPSGAIDIEVSTATPHETIWVAMGDTLELEYSAALVDEANIARNLVLRRPGGEPAFAAFDTTSVPTATQLDLSPITIEAPPTTCEPIIERKFGISLQQAGLRVTYDGQTVDVFANGDAYVGQLTSYRVLTDRLRRIHCFPEDSGGYNYAVWYTRAAFFQIPEG